MAEAQILENGLVCEDLHFAFGDNVLLDGVSFSVERGKSLAIMGRSGSGKSTLLKTINLLLRCSSGSARLNGKQYMEDGRPLYAPNEIRSEIQLVFQHSNLFPNLTAEENITLPLRRVRGISSYKAKALAYDISEQLGIQAVLTQFPETLSGGEAQRVALARSLALNPSVLLLDEVTAALDPEAVARIIQSIETIRNVEAGRDVAIVLVTHLFKLAYSFADQIAFLHRGAFVEKWPAVEFAKEISHPVAVDYVHKYATGYFT